MLKPKFFGLITIVLGFMLGLSIIGYAQDMSNGADNFYQGQEVGMEKVTFENQYKMKVAGNLFKPKGFDEKQKYPAIIVGHPMGAVKEQSANLYAAKMAEHGFLHFSPERCLAPP